MGAGAEVTPARGDVGLRPVSVADGGFCWVEERCTEKIALPVPLWSTPNKIIQQVEHLLLLPVHGLP